jgi:hypothetical protein
VNRIYFLWWKGGFDIFPLRNNRFQIRDQLPLHTQFLFYQGMIHLRKFDLEICNYFTLKRKSTFGWRIIFLKVGHLPINPKNVKVDFINLKSEAIISKIEYWIRKYRKMIMIYEITLFPAFFKTRFFSKRKVISIL